MIATKDKPLANKRQALTAKEQSAVEYYLDPDSESYNNWEQSYLKAGYKEYNGWERNAITVRHKPHVNGRIEERRAEIRAETGWSVARSQRALLRICKQAETINQPSAAVSAIVALNRRFHPRSRRTRSPRPTWACPTATT